MKVSVWLEELHDKRVEVTKVHDAVVKKIIRRMKSLDATLLIDKYTTMIQNIKDSINNIDDVGEDINECSQQIAVLNSCERGLTEVSEKCLKLVSTCEALDNNLYGNVSMECNMHAYDSLQVCADLHQIIENKTEVIQKSIEIFEELKLCMKQFKDIEDTIKGGKSFDPEALGKTLHYYITKVNNMLGGTTSDIRNNTVRYVHELFILYLS